MDKQPLNTGEQKDMTEFFTDLIGKIEEMSPVLVRELCFVKPHGNGRNIVGQQLLTFLDVTYCVRLHTVPKKKNGQAFETIPPNISLVP